MKNKKEIIGLILAAGYSSRMGAFKPLLPIGDATAVEMVAETLKTAGVHRIIGVTGHQREQLIFVFTARGITEAYNPDYDRGMFSSVKAGIQKALAGSPDGFLLMLVDCPLIPPEVIERILELHEEKPDAFILPCYQGKNGHPLFIPALYAEEILSYDGDGGLKAIRSRHEDKLIRMEMGTEAVVLDMDTPEGYEEILSFYESRQKEPDYAELLRGRRLFLIRHGETRQHKEKIFLGQTDVPLSDKGREQAGSAAAELLRYGVSAKRIYTSDLARASETAERIKDVLKGHRQPQSEEEDAVAMTLILEPRLREMSLGDWDGKYISEIRQKYPEEYERRGQNLLVYKFGNDSENFYDLQYRVMKGFRSILNREAEAGADAKDIVITAHRGVIHVILSSLSNRPLKEVMKSVIPCGGLVVLDYTERNEQERGDTL